MSHPAPSPEAVSYPAAELDRRFYAFAIDRLIAWGLFAGAGYLAWRYFFDDDNVGAGVGVIVGTVVLVSLVYAVLLGMAGISPGKALVGLRVVGAEDGRPIGLPNALLRTGVLGIFTLPTLGLGLATLAWTAVMDPGGRRRGGHDRMSGAVVVDVRPMEVAEVADDRPRAIVNLTAMRLMPAPPAEVLQMPVRVERPPSPSAPSGPAPSGAAYEAPYVQQAPAPQALPQRQTPSAPQPPAASAPAPVRPLSPAQPAQPFDRPVPAPGAHAAVPSEQPTLIPGGPGATPGGESATVRRPEAAEQAPAPVWRVSFDTGETFVVEGLALVGRRPEPRANEVVTHLVPLRSSDMSLSKTHAQFQVVPDGALVVMDRGSTNGSVVVRQGVSKSLTAGRPATLLEGDTVRFGDRTMTVAKDA